MIDFLLRKTILIHGNTKRTRKGNQKNKTKK